MDEQKDDAQTAEEREGNYRQEEAVEHHVGVIPPGDERRRVDSHDLSVAVVHHRRRLRRSVVATAVAEVDGERTRRRGEQTTAQSQEHKESFHGILQCGFVPHSYLIKSKLKSQ